MSSALIISLKVIYVTILLSLFTFYFGLPSYKSYSQHRVMFTDETVNFRQDNSPALLVAHVPVKPKNFHIIHACLENSKSYKEEDYAEAVKCIDENVKNKTEIFQDIPNDTKDFLGDKYETVPIGNTNKIFAHIKCFDIPDSWEFEFDERFWLGKKYSLTKYEFPLDRPLFIPLINDRVWIEIFDPDFYVDSEKFMTVPKYKLILEPNTSVQIDIKAEYFEMLNTPSKPCNDSSQYSFTKCVKVKQEC